jgi:hypothetical protein
MPEIKTSTQICLLWLFVLNIKSDKGGQKNKKIAQLVQTIYQGIPDRGQLNCGRAMQLSVPDTCECNLPMDY